MNYTLDTNIILFFQKYPKFKRRVDEKFGLNNPEVNAIISVVVVAELTSIALKNNWGEKRIEELNATLESFIIIDIKHNKIIDVYAQIDAFSQNKLPNKPLKTTARNMGKNDIWIAATASLTNSQLLTTDKDFTHLDKAFLDLQVIDAKEWI